MDIDEHFFFIKCGGGGAAEANGKRAPIAPPKSNPQNCPLPPSLLLGQYMKTEPKSSSRNQPFYQASAQRHRGKSPAANNRLIRQPNTIKNEPTMKCIPGTRVPMPPLSTLAGTTNQTSYIKKMPSKMSVPCCQTGPVDPRNFAITTSRHPTTAPTSNVFVDPRNLNQHHHQIHVTLAAPPTSATSLTTTPTPSPGSAHGYSSGGEAMSPDSRRSTMSPQESVSSLSSLNPNSPHSFTANSPDSNWSSQAIASSSSQQLGFSPQHTFSAVSPQHSQSLSPQQSILVGDVSSFSSQVLQAPPSDVGYFNNSSQQSMMDMLASPSPPSFHSNHSMSSQSSLTMSPQQSYSNDLVELPTDVIQKALEEADIATGITSF